MSVIACWQQLLPTSRLAVTNLLNIGQFDCGMWRSANPRNVGTYNAALLPALGLSPLVYIRRAANVRIRNETRKVYGPRHFHSAYLHV